MDDCPDCHGLTVTFKGKGLDTEYRICPHYKEDGHLTEPEIRARVAATRRGLRPSGRTA